jgi:8-hydroxy-5-deazaflavin:NADPH oxidoreductase
MKIGILGSGDVARALAAGFLQQGDDVMMGTRDASKLAAWAREHGPVGVGTFAEAAAHGEVLVLAVKGSAASDVLRLAGKAQVAGKPVLDTTNPIADAAPVNGVIRFFTDHESSLLERLQREFPEARLVKAFSCVGNRQMVKPRFTEGRPTMFICGDDEPAKEIARGILDRFGWDTEDMGTATAARAIEPLCILWCIPGFLRNEWSHAFKLVRSAPGPVVHRVEAEALPVNAYLVETERGVVAVDGLLTVSDGRRLRARVDEFGKPLLGVLITHPHPDHYAGVAELVAGQEVPVVATAGVAEVIRRDDAGKAAILEPMFGDEWPRERTFPTRTVADGETVAFDGVRFRVVDLGPGESPYDSLWVLEGAGPPQVFVGDVVYNRMHAYLADGHHDAWLGNLERVRAMFPADSVFYVGHGPPASPAHLDWQAGYIRAFLDAIRDTDEDGGDMEAVSRRVTGRMREYLPGDDLLFLMQLSIEPQRAGLAVSGGS